MLREQNTSPRDLIKFGKPVALPTGLKRRPTGLKRRPCGLKQRPCGLKRRPTGLKQRPCGLKRRPTGLIAVAHKLNLRAQQT